MDTPPTPERDARLADVLESFFERAAGGETVEIENETDSNWARGIQLPNMPRNACRNTPMLQRLLDWRFRVSSSDMKVWKSSKLTSFVSEASAAPPRSCRRVLPIPSGK